MRKRARLSLLLSLLLFVLQATGLHLHAHAPGASGGNVQGLIVHLALATDHAGDSQRHHDEGLELSLPDSNLLKKAGGGDDLPGILASAGLPTPASVRQRSTVFFETREPLPAAAPFERPRLRAPPAHHSI